MLARRSLLVTLTVPLLLTACAGTQPRPAGQGAKWRYSADAGPAHWATLDPAYATCATGRSQSPVDLAGAQHAPAAPLTPAYRQASFTVVDNGHTIAAASHGAAGSIVLGNARYELIQFHFHAPSEHTIAGRSFPMELHLVHRSADGRLVVIGVMIREGQSSSALAPLFEDLPAKGSETGANLDPVRILPAGLSSYRYSGSLTTPPCSESVRWIVLEQPIELSRDQILAFKHRYFGTNRPVQPLYGRMVAAAS